MDTKEIQESFCLFKSEAYLLGKKDYIDRKIKASGLGITEVWTVRLTFGDVFRLYEKWIPRMVMIMRIPPLFNLDMYILKGPGAVNNMHNLKHQIRNELWRFRFVKGGFVHAPDSIKEACQHKRIISKRIKCFQSPPGKGLLQTDN
jgi:hypothetical protein